jgi:hypothetical protein
MINPVEALSSVGRRETFVVSREVEVGRPRIVF